MDENTMCNQFGLVRRNVLTNDNNEELDSMDTSDESSILGTQAENNTNSELSSMISSTVGNSILEAQPENIPPGACELSERIKSQIRCQICDKTPEPDELYQCPWGHLMCKLCTFHLIGNANFYNKKAKCQKCDNVITWNDMRLNSSLQLVMKCLKYKCPQCTEQLEYNQLEVHKMESCPERVLLCKYRVIGCKWQGSFNQSIEHELTCSYKEKKACDLLNKIKNFQKSEENKFRHFNIVYKKLSSLAVKCINLEMKPYRSWATQQICFKSNFFRVFHYKWNVTIVFFHHSIEGHEYERKMNYRLILTGIRKKPIKLSFCLMSNPEQPITIVPQIYKHTFKKNRLVSYYNAVNIPNGKDEINEILTLQKMMIRFYMFLM